MSNEKKTIKGLEFLMGQLDMTNKVVDQFKNMEGGYNEFINNMMQELPEDQKQDLAYFKAQADRAIKMARNGNGSYEEVLAKAQAAFRNKYKDGSNNNG